MTVREFEELLTRKFGRTRRYRVPLDIGRAVTAETTPLTKVVAVDPQGRPVRGMVPCCPHGWPPSVCPDCPDELETGTARAR